MFLTQQGEYLFETTDSWTAYLPVDYQRWWDPRNIRAGVQKAEYAPDSREYVDLVKKAAQQAVPSLPRAQPIYSPLMGEDRHAYLYYIVTVEDLLPKKHVGQAEPDLRSGSMPSPDRRPPTALETPGQMPKPVGPVSTDGLSADAEGWIILPPLAQTDRDTQDARWKWDGQTATFGAQRNRALVSFPVLIEGSYELQTQVTIAKAKATTAICLPVVGGKAVVLGMKGDKGAAESPTATIQLSGLNPSPQPKGPLSMNVGTEYAF
jgi:hypothetical protein